MAEYVHTAYGRRRWPDPGGLDLDPWTDWPNTKLDVHTRVLSPGVAVGWGANRV